MVEFNLLEDSNQQYEKIKINGKKERKDGDRNREKTSPYFLIRLWDVVK